ncbi:hypothetical protein BR93DRAFT_917903 [Coniochaeta sp. PMI_546]|nr:hypothetical protein BR93DRAFT_917903 [Coniochaeta sp. PMI_546]
MPASRRPATTRACDSCRRRKVKCDALDVCSNCRISDISCQYTSIPRKRGPKVPRPSSDADHHSPQCTPDLGIRSLHNHGPPSESLPWLSSPTSTGHRQTLEQSIAPRPDAAENNDFSALSPVLELLPTPSSAQKIRDDLVQVIISALPSVPVLQLVNNCIDLYLQYTFPTAPMIHEPTLRASASAFFSEASATNLFSAQDQQQEVARIRAFTLLTGFCASVASVMPESLLPCRQILAAPCLRASRDLLRSYEDFDIEHPDSTSVVTRILQATAMEHITGKTALSYHVLGQANLLIRSMRLYSENALKNHDEVEAQILRNVYWQMYAADKASVCLGSRPPLIHELLLNEEPTVRPSGEHFVSLLDANKPTYDRTFEERLLIGFQFLPRLWSTAASLLFDMKAHARGSQEATKTRLTQAYMEFLGIMDDVPQWLQASNVIFAHSDSEVVQMQKAAFWVQRCTILVTFQCLRLVLLQQSIESKVWDVLGLNDNVLTLPMAKIEVVNDFVKTLDDIPFIYVQIKGEPTVSTSANSLQVGLRD